MAVKYIYILYKCGVIEEKADVIKHYIGDFHVPIDGYILEGLKVINDSSIGKVIDARPWSKWDDYNKYIDLQKERETLEEEIKKGILFRFKMR